MQPILAAEAFATASAERFLDSADLAAEASFSAVASSACFRFSAAIRFSSSRRSAPERLALFLASCALSRASFASLIASLERSFARSDKSTASAVESMAIARAWRTTRAISFEWTRAEF